MKIEIRQLYKYAALENSQCAVFENERFFIGARSGVGGSGGRFRGSENIPILGTRSLSITIVKPIIACNSQCPSRILQGSWTVGSPLIKLNTATGARSLPGD